jgi:hypothetical protein
VSNFQRTVPKQFLPHPTLFRPVHLSLARRWKLAPADAVWGGESKVSTESFTPPRAGLVKTILALALDKKKLKWLNTPNAIDGLKTPSKPGRFPSNGRLNAAPVRVRADQAVF